jgi:probable HAF family extracellular repeat protein
MTTRLFKKLLVWFLGAVAIVVALSLFTATNATARFYYTVTDLGTLGGSNSYVSAINDRGQIVGSSRTSSGQENAFLWENGTMKILDSLPGTSSREATGINNRGQIVGFIDTPSTTRAVLWEDGTIRKLALPNEFYFTEADAICRWRVHSWW